MFTLRPAVRCAVPLPELSGAEARTRVAPRPTAGFDGVVVALGSVPAVTAGPSVTTWLLEMIPWPGVQPRLYRLNELPPLVKLVTTPDTVQPGSPARVSVT